MKKLTIVVLMTLSFAACKKISDKTAPIITITSPTDGQMFGKGDSMSVVYTITDEDVHEYSFDWINTTTGDTLTTEGGHTHGNVSVNKKFKLPSDAFNLKILINAEDHTGNVNSKSVNFHTM